MFLIISIYRSRVPQKRARYKQIQILEVRGATPFVPFEFHSRPFLAHHGTHERRRFARIRISLIDIAYRVFFASAFSLLGQKRASTIRISRETDENIETER